MFAIHDMLPLRHRRQQGPSANPLRNPTNDPSFPLSEGSQTPATSHLAQNMRQSSNGNDFHQNMAHVSHPSLADGCNWPQDYSESSDDIPFDDFIDFGEDQPAESAPQMAAGPSQSSESSHSSSSSKRHKSNDVSARSSFSLANGADNTAATNYSFPGVSLSTNGYALGIANQPSSSPHDVDGMNRMTSNLAVRSTGNSSPDSTDSNPATGQAIAGMSMPYDTSPDVKIDPITMTEPPYVEPFIDSAEASPVTMAWPRSALPGPFANNATLPSDSSLIMPNQGFWPHQNTIGHWYGQNLYRQAQPPPLTNQKQKFQKMFNLSANPRPSGTYFAVMSNRTGTRVETALDIRFVLGNPPLGISKIRIHEEHLTKVKHLKDRHLPLSPDVLELRATVFCTSALTSPDDVQRAMNRAASIATLSCNPQIKDENSPSKENCEYRPLEGCPVHICEGCVSREAKRLRRSKPKIEETDEWLHNASHRTLVFNNAQFVDWKTPNSSTAAEQLLSQPTRRTTDEDKDEDGKKKATRKLPPPPIEPGTIAADLAMRICCYCRHQNELNGFRVVFTLTDYQGQVFGQQVTNAIMITDDHKDKDKKDSAPPTPPQNSESTQLPGRNFIFNAPAAPQFSAGIQQSFSTPNLTAMAQGHALVIPENMGTPKPFQAFQPTFPNNTDMPHVTSGTLTPQTRSRQASPTGATGPQCKKRKASGSGRMLEQLRMTPMDPAQSSNSGPHGAAAVRRAQAPSHRLNRFSHPVGVAGYRTNPPSPPNAGFGTFTEAHRSQSMDNVVSATFSVPTSTHQSRQSSPPSVTQGGGSMGYQPDLVQALDCSLRNVQATDSFGQQRPTSQPRPQQATLPQQQLSGQGVSNFYPPPSSSPPRIEQVVPSWGPVEGGTPCVLLGIGFHDELQVFFGNRCAISVQSRHGVSLTCTVPPGDGPGVVPIRIEHRNSQGLATQNAEPLHLYEYVAARSSELGQGQGQVVPMQNGNTSSAPPGNYTNGMAQWQAINGMGQYQQQYQQQQYGYPQQMYAPESDPGYQHGSRQGFTETPPSYHDVLAEDDQRKLDMKTRSTLHAVGDALLDQKAQEAFDATGTSIQTTGVEKYCRERSRSMDCVTIGRNPVSEEQKAKLRAERENRVKGLRSDRKLWAVWLPILILVMIAMTYDRVYLVWTVVCALVGYVKEILLPSIKDATQRSVGYIQDQMIEMRRLVQVR